MNILTMTGLGYVSILHPESVIYQNNVFEMTYNSEIYWKFPCMYIFTPQKHLVINIIPQYVIYVSQQYNLINRFTVLCYLLSIFPVMADYNTDLHVQKDVCECLQSMRINTETHNCTKYSELETLEHSALNKISPLNLSIGDQETLQKDCKSHCR